MTSAGTSEGTIKSFSTTRNAYTPPARGRRVVINSVVYDLYGREIKPTNKLIDLPTPTRNPNIPILRQTPKPDKFLLAGRGIVRAQLERASQEERERNIGEALAQDLKFNKVRNTEDYKRQQQLEEAVQKALSPNSPPPTYANEAFERKQFDRRKRQRRQMDTEQPETKAPPTTPKTPDNGFINPLKIDTKNEALSGFSPMDVDKPVPEKPDRNPKGVATKRKNLKKPAQNKRVKAPPVKRKAKKPNNTVLEESVLPPSSTRKRKQKAQAQPNKTKKLKLDSVVQLKSGKKLRRMQAG